MSLLDAARRFIAQDTTYHGHRREWLASKHELEAACIRAGHGLPDREGLYDRNWTGYALEIIEETPEPTSVEVENTVENREKLVDAMYENSFEDDRKYAYVEHHMNNLFDFSDADFTAAWMDNVEGIA